MKILLVDNEKTFRTDIRRILSRNGHEILTAARWSEALQRLERQIIHVVLLGVRLPDMEGVEALIEIKNRFPLAEAVMLAEPETMDCVVDGLKLGASDYLLKTDPVEEVVQKAEAALSRQQQLEQRIRAAQIGVLEAQFSRSRLGKYKSVDGRFLIECNDYPFNHSHRGNDGKNEIDAGR